MRVWHSYRALSLITNAFLDEMVKLNWTSIQESSDFSAFIIWKIHRHIWHGIVGIRPSCETMVCHDWWTLQRLLWLDSPIMEWQSFMQLWQMNLDGIGFCLTFFCWCLFCWVVSVLISSVRFVPVLVMLLQTTGSEAVSSQLSVLVWHAFMSCLHTSLSLKCGHPLGQEPGGSSPYSMSFGILPLSIHLTWPSQCIWHCISRLCWEFQFAVGPWCWIFCPSMWFPGCSLGSGGESCLVLLHDRCKLSMFHCCTVGCWGCKHCKCRS